MKKYLLLSFITLLCIGFASCSSDDDYKELELNTTKMYSMPTVPHTIRIVSGNGGYVVESSDESVLKAAYIESSAISEDIGEYIRLSPQKKGVAIITVTDSESRVATVEVTVVDDFLSMEIQYFGSMLTSAGATQEMRDALAERTGVPLRSVVSLVKDDNKTLLVHASRDAIADGEVAILKGTYSFSEIEGLPYVIFKIKDEQYYWRINEGAINRYFCKFFMPEWTLQRDESTTKESEVNFNMTFKQDCIIYMRDKFPNANVISAFIDMNTALLGASGNGEIYTLPIELTK